MIRLMEREPKTLEEAFKIAERMELYNRRVDNSDRSDMESKQRSNSNKVRAATAVGDKNLKMLMENQAAMQQQIASIIQTMQQLSQQQQEAQDCRQPVRASCRRTYNCYNCEQEGHISSRFPDRNNRGNYFRTNDRKKMNCYTCGKEGHISSRCKEPRNDGEFTELARSSSILCSDGSQSAVRKIGRALYMRIRIEDNAYDCLISTGSEVNLMPSKHVEGMRLQPSSRLLQAANGTTIGVLGETEIQVEISRRRIPMRFIVSDQVDEILIGVEWLQENNCQIIFPKNSIMINGEVVPLLKKAIRVRCNRIILQEDVCVPASSEMNVMGKMVYTYLPTTNKGTWATSPSECEPGVHTACSLIPNRSMNIPVRILIVKQQPQTIEKGAYLTTVPEVTLLKF